MEFRKILQRIDGINKALASRIVEKGFGSLEELADAESADLAGIPGLTEKAIPEILKQAKTMLESQQKEEESLAELTGDTEKLKDAVEQLVLHIRNRFDETTVPKEQLKELRKETARTLASLERVEAALTDQLQRFGKGLAKADQEISEIAGVGVNEVISGLKKARKKIDKALD
jgi:transcription termination factor NusA